jgi:hypothetical protein
MQKEPDKAIDTTPVLLKLTNLNYLISNALEVNQTMLAYHKLLLDEVLHLQEMSIQINHSTLDLEKLQSQLASIKEEVRNL